MENNTFTYFENAESTDHTSIDEFIENNFGETEVNEADNEIDNEIFNDIFKDNIISEDAISIYIDNLITPATLGLGFFDTSNLFTAINMILPDLFRRSFAQHPLKFKKNQVMVCPTYARMPLEKFNNIKYSYNNFFQLLLDENIIKGFLYFNFSSNPNKMKRSDFQGPTLLLKYRWYDISPKQAETINSGNYTAPETFFSDFYNNDSLIVQLLNFQSIMDSSTQNKDINNTNFPPYFIPWVTSYSCLNNKPNFNDFYVYNNVENPLKNNLMLYSDMYYLGVSKNTYTSVARELEIITNIFGIEDIISKNNIYIILKYADDVYNEILKEIESLFLYKEYKQPEYSSFETFLKCMEVYCNYIANESFLFTNSDIFNDRFSEFCKQTRISREIWESILNRNYNSEEHNYLKKKLEEEIGL